MRTSFLIYMLLMLCCFNSEAQIKDSFARTATKSVRSRTSVSIRYIFPDRFPDSIALLRQLKLPKSSELSAPAILKTIQNIHGSLYESGYFSAELSNRLASDSTILSIYLIPHQALQWARLGSGNIPEQWLSIAGYSSAQFKAKPFDRKQLNRLMERMLRFAENNGYPFAELSLSKVIFLSDDSVSAELHLMAGKQITWDTLEITGDSAIRPKFIAAYLGVQKGRIYSEQQALQIESRLKELFYLQLVRKPQVIFIGDKAILRLVLQTQKASRLNGILGLAPNSANAQNKLLLTGEVDLELINLFSRGIRFELDFKNFLNNASQLGLAGNYPYLFNTPLGTGGSFRLQRIDTAFIIVESQFNLSYSLSALDNIGVSISNYTTSILNAEYYQKSHQKPPYLDLSINWYGLNLRRERLDYRINPKKGYSLYIEGSAGIKRIQRNPQLGEQFYDSIRLSKSIYRITTDNSFYAPLGKRSVGVIGISGALLTDNEVLQNQMFRIGGFRTLRGFDEGSILASSYILPRAEYRFLTDASSFISAFYNAAFYQKNLRGNKFSDTPYGFGLGYTYLTKVGFFNVSFAVGKQQQNPLDLSASKVHVGYLSRF